MVGPETDHSAAHGDRAGVIQRLGRRELMIPRQPAGDRLAAGDPPSRVMTVGNTGDRVVRREQLDHIAVMVDQPRPGRIQAYGCGRLAHCQPVLRLLCRHELARAMH